MKEEVATAAAEMVVARAVEGMEVEVVAAAMAVEMAAAKGVG